MFKKLLQAVLTLCMTFTAVLPVYGSQAQQLVDTVSTTVLLGDELITIAGKNYSLESTPRGLYDLEQNEDGTYNGELKSFYTDSSTYPIGNKKVADFATETGLTDTEGHGNVIVIPGSENQNSTCRMSFSNLNPNAGTSIKNGLFAVTFDILFTQGTVDTAGNLWVLYLATPERGYSYQSAIYNPWKIGGNSITYNGQSVVDFTNNEWKRVGIIFDLDSDYYHFIIDNKYVGSEKIVNSSGVQQDITQIGRIDLYPRGASNGVTCFDNAAIYHYAPIPYTATVKGADISGNISDTIKCTDTRLAVQFNTDMYEYSLDSGNIDIRYKNGDSVRFYKSDYNKSTRTLFIDLAENIAPDTEYEIVFNSWVKNADELGFSDDKVFEFTSSHLTAEDYSYGVVENVAATYIDLYNGTTSIYPRGESPRIIINGTEYETIETFKGIIPVNSYARYYSVNDKIFVFDFDTEPIRYTDVTYNATDKKFNTEKDAAFLPVYDYNNGNGALFDLTPDEHHKYTVDFYDYGVVVVDYKAVDKAYTVKNIKVENGVNYDFTQYLDVYFDSDARNVPLKYELTYSGNSVASGVVEYENYYSDDNSGVFRISPLPNIDRTYNLKLYIQDENGDAVSPQYSKNFNSYQISPLYGMLEKVGSSDGWIPKWQIKIWKMKKSDYEIYDIADNVIINGERYKIDDSFEELVPSGYFVQYGLNDDGEIYILNIDNTAKTYTDVTYSSSSGFSGVTENVQGPVLYCEDNPPYTSEDGNLYDIKLDTEHKYTIDVYDYGVIVRNVSAINKEHTIRKITADSSAAGDGTHCIIVSFESFAEGAYLGYEIYDKEAVLKYEDYNFGNGECEFTVPGFPNIQGSYSVYFWLQDSEGNELSPVYSRSVFVRGVLFETGFVTDVADSYGWDSSGSIRVFLPDGNPAEYPLADKIRINGELYDGGEYNGEYKDLTDLIPVGLFAKYAIGYDGIITDILFDDTAKEYYGVYYNDYIRLDDGTIKGKFLDIEEDTLGLPVLNCDGDPSYEYYDGEIYALTPDREHTYDIEVYDYGVIIRDYETISKKHIIKDITVARGVDADYTNTVNIKFKPDNPDLYFWFGIKHGRFSSVLLHGASTCTQNEDGYCTVSIRIDDEYYNDYHLFDDFNILFRLQDANGNSLSPSYTVCIPENLWEKQRGTISKITQAEIFGYLYNINVDIEVDGELKNYDMAHYVYIDGERYSGKDERIWDLISKNQVVNFATYDGMIYIMSTNETFVAKVTDAAVQSGGKAQVETYISNPLNEDKDIKIYAALYRENALADIVHDAFTLTAGDVEIKNISVNDIKEGDILKTYIWDKGLGSYMPSVGYTVINDNGELKLSKINQ